MIFVSVGTQLPFERLIEAVDEWAAKHPRQQVFAQIGETRYQPKHIEYVAKLAPSQYSEKFEQADLVISHVGMGTIIKGLETAKPLILMPRLADKGEHRNDHQLGTAEKFSRFSSIHIVHSGEEIAESLADLLDGNGSGEAVQGAKPETSPELIEKLKSFVSA